MYKVSDSVDKKYGNVVVIAHDDMGEHQVPFAAMQHALKNRRLWQEKTDAKIRFLVDGKIMTPPQLETWSRQEYQSLPKCYGCAKILINHQVHNHPLNVLALFCSSDCADKDYMLEIEKIKDEQDCDL